MRKVCVVITARASYARIRTVLTALDLRGDVQLQIVLAGSAVLAKYGDVAQQLASDGLTADASVFSVLEGETLVTSAKSTGYALSEIVSVFARLNPDVVVTIADRYETIATAIAASYMNIPLAHVQGGEVTGSIDDKVRNAVTQLADWHFVSTKQAEQRVIAMGAASEQVFITGCPSIDLAAEVYAEARRSPAIDFDPIAKYGGVGADLDCADGYLVVLQHPVTTEYDEARAQITETLEAVHASGQAALWFWPNVDAGSDGVSAGIRAFREREDTRMRFFKHMAPLDFLRLILHSRGLIGNSSVGIRESAYLGVPVVNIGSRQRGRERGQNVTDVPCERQRILDAIYALRRDRYPMDPIYGDGHAGERMAGLLATVPLARSVKVAA